MGEGKLFQVCHEGDLTLEVSDALRRLRAEANFDQSWRVELDEPREAEVLVRYLRMTIGGDARLLVAPLQLTRARDYLLVRHSLTPGSDYGELHGALERLGWVLDLPFASTFVVETEDRTDLQSLGEGLSHLCPDESLMVTGISANFSWCTGTLGRPGAGAAVAAISRVRAF